MTKYYQFGEDSRMAISYNKLWKLLIDKKMKKKDLRLKAGVSTAVIAKMGKGENLTTDMLIKVCNALDCDISDICELDRALANPVQKAAIEKCKN